MLGVNPNNNFVLATTHTSSLDHTLGYNEVVGVCEQAKVSTEITATKNRHRLCTSFSEIYKDTLTMAAIGINGNLETLEKNLQKSRIFLATCEDADSYLNDQGCF